MNKSDIYCVSRATLLITDFRNKINRSYTEKKYIISKRKITGDAFFTSRRIGWLKIQLYQSYLKGNSLDILKLNLMTSSNATMEKSAVIFDETDNMFLKNRIIPGEGSGNIEKYHNGTSLNDFE